MSSDTKPSLPSATGSTRIGVSDVKVSWQGAGMTAGEDGGTLTEALGQAGRDGLIVALTEKVIREAAATTLGRRLTRREAAQLATRIADRLIAETAKRTE